MSDSSAKPQTAPPRLHFRVPPEPAHLLRARERIRDYLRQHCSQCEVGDDLVMCIEEAATNVIRHSGSDKHFEISLGFEGGDLVAEVRDHGHGFEIATFDREAVPDVLSDHGRGLFLISRLCDEMELRRDGGLEVRMAKRAVASCPAALLESGFTDLPTSGRLNHRDARLRTLLEEIDEAFIALDWEYRYVQANTRALRMAGKSLEELLGRRPSEVFPATAGPPLERPYREAMELGQPSVVEYQTYERGTWLEARIYPTPAGLSAYFRDITERKRKESERNQYLVALRDSEERFRSLFESMTEGVALHELIYEDGRAVDYRILDVNPSFERQTGVAAQSARGQLASDLYGTGVAPYLSEYAEVVESGQPYSFETYFEPMARHFRITAISPAQGRFATVFEDITEAKQTDEQRQRLLEESQVQGDELRVHSEDLRERTDQLVQRVALGESLEEINRLIYSTLAPDEIMRQALVGGMAALSAATGVIEMREGESWSVRYRHGLATEDSSPHASEAEALVATRAALLQESVAIDDLSLETAVGVGFVRARGLRSALAVPLLVRGAVVGCLLFCGATPRAFTAAELDFSRKLGSVVSLSLENARLSEGEREAAQLDEALTGSRTTRFVRWLRSHPWHVLLASIAIEIAFLVSIAALKDSRRILGLPGSLLALTAVIAGAATGPLVGALVGLAGGITFYATVADYGSRSSLPVSVISTGIWVAAGLLSGLLSRSLREQVERRRGAAVALARAAAAREVQLADQRRVEELAEELQVQTRDLQASGEELQVQAAELREQSEEIAVRAALAEALNAINGVVHSTLDFGDIMQRALDRGVSALGVDAGTIELREEGSWVIACQHGLSGEGVGARLSAEQAPIAARAWVEMEPFAIADLASRNR